METANKPAGFTIRVYGLFLDRGNRVLLSDEFRLGQRMTKFPGGGLELGEGPEDCLLRECREELGQEVEILGHFYTTGFYQPSFLLPITHQLISIYYRIRISEPYLFDVRRRPFDYGQDTEGAQSFRFREIMSMEEDELTFPIDRHVFSMLQRSMDVS
ncbi:MAG: NUDIX domain-containing protein [Bacteroidales bacterium]|nr:NUDIX domain-containing protein [Bacteroidales bacterium]